MVNHIYLVKLFIQIPVTHCNNHTTEIQNLFKTMLHYNTVINENTSFVEQNSRQK